MMLNPVGYGTFVIQSEGNVMQAGQQLVCACVCVKAVAGDKQRLGRTAHCTMAAKLRQEERYSEPDRALSRQQLWQSRIRRELRKHCNR